MTIEGDTSSAAAALTALLHRKREPLTGVAISERVLIDNQVAYTQAVPAYDDLFILSAMHKAGVPEAELLPVLREKTTHDSPSVRLIAARRMSELGPEARRVAAGTLVSLLTETRVDIQEQAVSILSKLGADASGSVAALTELLANGNSPVRQAAARALGEIGPPAKSAAPALQQAIQFEKLMGTGGQDVMVEALEKLVGPPAPKA
jgi:HEAT repeat protein